MEFTGTIKNISNDFVTGDINITFSANEKQKVLAEYEEIRKCPKLKISVVRFKNKRSLDANAYIWVLLQKMAEVLRSTKEELYLDMLSKYGVFTHIIVKPNVVERVKSEWRTVRDLGEVTVNGQTGIQLQCYFGSSTYDIKEMSVLIDGIVNECIDLKIETLTQEEIDHMKSMWGV